MERVILSLDGNCGCALLGPDLQEGEAEFVEVTDAMLTQFNEHRDWHPRAARKACFEAMNKLLARLGKGRLPYAWYPRQPWASGA